MHTMHRKWIILVTLPSLVISLLLFIIFFNVHVINSPPFPTSKTAVLQTQFSLLIGILMPITFIVKIDVKFIFCNLTKLEQRILISLKILRFNDIIILNCIENMNNGKTYTYFCSLPHFLLRKYNYVVKAYDAIFIRLEPLALSLKPLPRIDLYYGFVIPCASMNPFLEYMSGMGFLLSWDLVEWIGESDIPRKEMFGPEDKMVGKWLKMGRKAKNKVSNKPTMYDYPRTNGKCSLELITETMAVLRLKRWDHWFHVLEFFNVTKRVIRELQKYFNCNS